MGVASVGNSRSDGVAFAKTRGAGGWDIHTVKDSDLPESADTEKLRDRYRYISEIPKSGKEKEGNWGKWSIGEWGKNKGVRFELVGDYDLCGNHGPGGWGVRMPDIARSAAERTT